jgi:hypothetical protein
MLSPLPSARAVLVLICLGCIAAAAAVPHGESLRDRFDQITPKMVAGVVRKAPPDDGGRLAWGESYLLSALVEMFAVTHDAEHAAKIIALGDWIDRARDDRNGRRDEIRDRVLPAWSSANYTKGRRYTWAVHTGMIAAPLARFAAIVRRDATLKARWGNDADRLLRVAQDAVAAFDDDYRPGPGPDEGHVYCPFLAKPLPLNMQNALARAWLAIADATGSAAYRERVTRLANFFRHRMRTEKDGCATWSYWPPLNGANDTCEDISHAAINVDFMVLCHEHGIVFSREDLERVALTLRQHVLLADDRIGDHLGVNRKFNTHRDAILRWGRLARHLPAVHDALVHTLTLPGLRDSTAEPLGLALLSQPPAAP